MTLDHDALKHLDAGFVTFDDVVVDANGVAAAKLRLLAAHVDDVIGPDGV